jgi:MFS family permease
MKKRLPKDIWLLGFVSFLTDLSSEAIFSVFALFFTTILGASTALLGLVEGFADASASSLDYVAGYLSDRSGKRKIYALIGYGFSTLAKVFLVIANSVPTVFAFRVIERLGKSFRGPPRDAWIAGVATKENRGLAFGVHKALDKSGAILGPLAAYFFLSIYGESSITIRWLFVVAVIPALLAVIVLLFLKDRPSAPAKRENIFKAYKTLTPEFKKYIRIAALFSVAYFSFSFLLLKAYSIGFVVKDVVLLYVLFNVAFVIASVPAGRLGDIIGRRRIILLSYGLYALMSVGFIFASSRTAIILLFVLFGVFYAIDEAQSKAFIADLELKKRGTAIGVYNVVTAIAYLPASIIAGFLWTMNPSYAFGFAAFVATAAIVVFLMLRSKK